MRRFDDERRYREDHRLDQDRYRNAKSTHSPFRSSAPIRSTIHSNYQSFGDSTGGGFDHRTGSESGYNLKKEIHDASPGFRESAKKEEPNFEVSGILAEDQNQRNGVPLTFSIAVDSGVPDADECDWRLFEFDDADNSVIHRLKGTSCFLFGSDERLVVHDAVEGDITYIYLRHESCSRQHAVIQFRNTNRTTPRPYLMDLNSSNGTALNRKAIESGRYIELRHQDVIEFGRLGKDYVLLNAKVS